MKTYDYEVYIANALKYIHLLPINEQINELNATLKRYRAVNKKVFWLVGKLSY